jgi:ABC transporter substrate binding protein
LDVDVIVTWGVTAGRIAKQATAKIPIVNGSMSDPVRAKLVDSLARPGGNLTGLTSANPDLAGKRLQLMKELVPTLSRAAVLATAAPTATFTLKETEVAPCDCRLIERNGAGKLPAILFAWHYEARLTESRRSRIAAGCRGNGYSALSYNWRIPLESNLSSFTSRNVPKNDLAGSTSTA